MTIRLKDMKPPLNEFFRDWIGIRFDVDGKTQDGVSCVNLIHIYYQDYKKISISDKLNAIIQEGCHETARKPAYYKRIVLSILEHEKFNMVHVGLFLPEDIIVFNEMHGGIMLTEYVFIHSCSTNKCVVIDDIRLFPWNTYRRIGIRYG